MRLQDFHLLVNRIAGLDHDDDRARRTNGGDEFLKRLARNNLPLQRARFGKKLLRGFRRAVELFAGDVAQLGSQQQVLFAQRGELGFHFALHQDAAHLFGDRQR